MSILSEHPKRIEFDKLIKENAYSYRQLQTEFLIRWGIKISFKAIQNYHTITLKGEVTPQPENTDFADGGTGLAIPIDVEKLKSDIQGLVDSKSHFANDLTPAQTDLCELYALQIQITKNALWLHANGQGRYPSEYIKNLVVLKGLLPRTVKE